MPVSNIAYSSIFSNSGNYKFHSFDNETAWVQMWIFPVERNDNNEMPWILYLLREISNSFNINPEFMIASIKSIKNVKYTGEKNFS